MLKILMKDVLTLINSNYTLFFFAIVLFSVIKIFPFYFFKFFIIVIIFRLIMTQGLDGDWNLRMPFRRWTVLFEVTIISVCAFSLASLILISVDTIIPDEIKNIVNVTADSGGFSIISYLSKFLISFVLALVFFNYCIRCYIEADKAEIIDSIKLATAKNFSIIVCFCTLYLFLEICFSYIYFLFPVYAYFVCAYLIRYYFDETPRKRKKTKVFLSLKYS